MTFEAAVRATTEIAQGYATGLRGLKGEHRPKMILGERRCGWRGSVDLDAVLAARYPNDPRWDYAIGFGRTSRPDGVAYVEVHPATSTHVYDVIRKKDWLISWIGRAAPALAGLVQGGFFWVSTDGIHIRSGTPQARQLAGKGIKLGKTALIG